MGASGFLVAVDGEGRRRYRRAVGVWRSEKEEEEGKRVSLLLTSLW